jgi:hypothetical protein
MADRERIATFHTTQEGMRAARMLQKQGVTAMLVPVPRWLSADCGIALTFPAADAPQVRAVLADAGIEVSGYHQEPDGSSAPP